MIEMQAERDTASVPDPVSPPSSPLQHSNDGDVDHSPPPEEDEHDSDMHARLRGMVPPTGQCHKDSMRMDWDNVQGIKALGDKYHKPASSPTHRMCVVSVPDNTGMIWFTALFVQKSIWFTALFVPIGTGGCYR